MTYLHIIQAVSKTDSRPELKSPWAAGAKDLIKATRRLAEGRSVGQVAAVARKVGNVQEIEGLANERQLVFFAQGEGAAQAQVLRYVVVPEFVISRQSELRDGL